MSVNNKTKYCCSEEVCTLEHIYVDVIPETVVSPPAEALIKYHHKEQEHNVLVEERNRRQMLDLTVIVNLTILLEYFDDERITTLIENNIRMEESVIRHDAPLNPDLVFGMYDKYADRIIQLREVINELINKYETDYNTKIN